MPEKRIGPYRLLAVLGQSKKTVVYKAWQETLGRPVTLKVLRKPEAGALRRLQTEAQFTARLAAVDRRVRQIYEVGQTPEGQVYVALQYVDYSLKELLDQHSAQRKPFTRDEIIEILRPVAGVLDEVHRNGLVHLDIKPENILIFKDTRQAMLADFGIAQKIGTQTRAGTPLYASPEQAAGNRPVGPWSDVYSLGVVAYAMAAGRPPFRGGMDVAVLRQHLEDRPPPLRKFRRDVESGLEGAINKALAKDPRRRFATAGEFVAALHQRETPISQAVKRTSTLLKETPHALKKRPWLGLFPLAVIVVVLFGMCLLWPLMSGRALYPKNVRTFTPTIPLTSEASATPTPTVSQVASVSPSPTTFVRATATIIPSATSSPTSRASRTPSVTPTPAEAYPAPYLDEPENGAQVKQGQAVSFTWSWGERSLKSDERYRFRFLRGGEIAGQPSVGRENWRHHAGAPGDVGVYQWCVDVVRVDQAGNVVQVLSPSACRQVTWK